MTYYLICRFVSMTLYLNQIWTKKIIIILSSHNFGFISYFQICNSFKILSHNYDLFHNSDLSLHGLVSHNLDFLCHNFPKQDFLFLCGRSGPPQTRARDAQNKPQNTFTLRHHVFYWQQLQKIYKSAYLFVFCTKFLLLRLFDLHHVRL